MGCANSKLDSLPPVALCRDRCKFIDEALRCSRLLADAHLAYMESLKTLGPYLYRFFDQNHNNYSDSSIEANLHVSKTDPSKSSIPAVSPDRSPSSLNSDSHLHFNSDSEDDDTDREFKSFSRIRKTYLIHDGTNFNYVKQSPSPVPSSSAWDFFNFFDATYERYEPIFDCSWDREVAGKIEVKLSEEKDTNEKIDKNATAKKDQPEERKKSDAFRSTSEKQVVSNVMREIQVLFEQASESGNEVSKMLSYRQSLRNGVYQVSGHLEFDEDARMNWRSLSSTLKKLCIWEKKLYAEVKAGERLRIVHERKCRQLKQLDEKRADAHKIDATRTLIRNLSTKLKVSIQVVDRISITISKLRDEELSNQITELIQGLLGMWRAMLDCHKHQYQAIAETKSLDAPASNGEINDGHLEAAMQLKLEFQNWKLSFSNWIVAQKDYVKLLNSWLLRCLLYEPEETPACTTPLTPSRIGAPPVFGTCNNWSQTMDEISEKEVIKAMCGFISTVDLVLEQSNFEMQHKLTTKKHMERSRVVLPVKTFHPSEMEKSTHMQSGLKQTFKAMEKFTANTAQAYESLCLQIGESRHAGENKTGP